MSDLAGRSASICPLDDCGAVLVWPEVAVEDHWTHVSGMDFHQEAQMAVHAALDWQARATEAMLNAHLNEYHDGWTRTDLVMALARQRYERALQALG